MTYTPPKVWTHDAPSGGTFASINAPTAGALLRPMGHAETNQFRRFL